MAYALITGASTGIGKAISLELAQRGWNLVLVARSEDKLKEVAKLARTQFQVQAHYFAQDLTKPKALPHLMNYIGELGVEIDTLVNNAGYALWGNFASQDIASQTNMMELNMQVLVQLSHAMIPMLARQPQAYLLNVGSTAAYQSVPTLSIYAATKAFVVNFSRGLRYELRAGPISVSCLSPGPTESLFTQRAGMEALQDLTDKFNMPAEQVAKVAVRAMLRGKSEIVPGVTNLLSRWLGRVFPPALTTWFSANLYEKRLPADKQ